LAKEELALCSNKTAKDQQRNLKQLMCLLQKVLAATARPAIAEVAEF